MLAARSSFVDIPTASRMEAGLLSIAALPPGPWLNLPGYNLCYLRPGAALGIVTLDEYAAPVVATMQAGLGRTAAFTPQIDGTFGVAEGDWSEAATVLVTLARWISGQAPPAEYYASVRREGREAVLQIDVDPELGDGTPLITRMVDPSGRSIPVELAPVGENRFEARIPLAEDGVYRFAAATEDGEIVPIDPIAVPYSPEFEARSERNAGERVLGTLARLSGGRLNPPTTELWRGNRGGRATRTWTHWFVLVGLLFLLAEITWRRLFEGSIAWRPRMPRLRSKSAVAHASDGAAPLEATASDVARAVKSKRRASKRKQGSSSGSSTGTTEAATPEPQGKQDKPAKAKDDGVEAALKQLKKKRRR